MNRIVSAVAAALGATLLVPLAASSAEAATCSSGTFCLYYNSGLGGSRFSLTNSARDLAGYTFSTSGAGQGSAVKNNAASAWNKTLCPVTVYFRSNYGGPWDSFGYNQSGNLVDTYNENASVEFSTTTC
ncbi:peptidase inhibitor family I36 protein [Streptomyces sp. NPDC057287]|uniref:peptidase inhibitor family I36 protein n=1 Tax=Streptomyces sp. NPDC057287 TaxID=3346086 RepID=UPI003645DB4F